MQNGCQLAFMPKSVLKPPFATADMLEHIQLCTKINNSVSFDVLSTNNSNASCRGSPAQNAGLGFANSPHDVGAQDQACSKHAGACQHWDGNSHHQPLGSGSNMVSGVGAPRARTALPANPKDTVSAASFTSTINCTRVHGGGVAQEFVCSRCSLLDSPLTHTAQLCAFGMYQGSGQSASHRQRTQLQPAWSCRTQTQSL